MKLKKTLLKLGVSLLTLLMMLALIEVVLRIREAGEPSPSETPGKKAPMYIPLNSPILYGLNPAHPEINSLGLRDDEMSVEKPAGTLRVLVLGDSVTFGVGVHRDKAFPNQLERLMRPFGNVEVINAGVPGYTAYNELQYYLTEGRKLEPDIVVLGFCMNDAVNPRLHWGGYTKKQIVDIPDEAIPNEAYDRNRAIPLLRQRQRQAGKEEFDPSFASRFALYRFVKRRMPGLFHEESLIVPPAPKRKPGAPDVPTYVTAEDSVSIEVLLDRTTPEWRWLAGIYDRLIEAIREDGGRLVFAAFPLAYQMDPGYPYLPQNQLAEFFKERSVRYVDLLPVFKLHPKGNIFFLNRASSYDIWHITEQGHTLTAGELMRVMKELVPLSETP